MNEKFGRRYFFKNFLREVGKTSTQVMRSFNLEDVVEEPNEANSKNPPRRRTETEPLAVATNKPKKSL